MSYVLGQFNQLKKSGNAEEYEYMELLPNGTPKRRKQASDKGVKGGSLDPFFDECIQFDSYLEPGTNYYFHTKIKRLENKDQSNQVSNQVFYVYLVNYEQTELESKTQYLDTIFVQGGDGWVDFEIVFSPLISFDCILFQLQRTIEDYKIETRYPVIVYEELSKINNIITSQISARTELIKIGVQSHPGLMMCINGEEIHIGRSGIYEVRNGIITVNFFSVVFGADENINGDKPLIDPTDPTKRLTIEEYLAYIASLPIVTSETETTSQCIFENSKLRNVDAFTLDYMYEEE